MKAKLKKVLPFILILLAVILLGVVVTIVLQFKFKGEVIDLNDPEKPIEEKSYDLVNVSSMDEEEITRIINDKRDELIAYLNPIQYYNLIDIDPTCSSEDNEKFMVLTNDFIDNLKPLITEDLLNDLTHNFDILKEEDDKIYYKVSKEEFNPLFNKSALNIFNYTDIEVYPMYANDDKIDSIIKFKYCDKEDKDLCRRNDDYQFNLIKDEDNWLIDNIGYSFDE